MAQYRVPQSKQAIAATSRCTLERLAVSWWALTVKHQHDRWNNRPCGNCDTVYRSNVSGRRRHSYPTWPRLHCYRRSCYAEPKESTGRHPRYGTIYFWCLAGIFITATGLALARWAEDYHLFVLGPMSFAAAYLGRQARRQRWRNWVRLHITGMGTSYVLLLTAFYVDNGKQLPIWKDLPHFTLLATASCHRNPAHRRRTAMASTGATTEAASMKRAHYRLI